MAAIKGKGDRYSGYSASIIDSVICDEVIEWISGGKTLREYCRQEDKPSYRVIYRWIEEDEAFESRFARARNLGHDVIAEECFDIADNGTNDWMERASADGSNEGWRLNGDHVQRSKLRIDTRLKLLAKWNPKYADKSAVELTGKDGGPISYADMSDDDLRKELEKLTSVKSKK